MAKTLILLLLALGVAQAQRSARAPQTVIELYAAAAEGDKTALEQLRTLAEQGNSFLQYILGQMYAHGKGVPKDSAQAVAWYRKAAEQGEFFAWLPLGLMYDIGDGVPKDSAQAAQWYRKAADQGSPAAQYLLGIMYGKGESVPKDFVTAYMWMNLAPARDYEDARKRRDTIAKQMTPDDIATAQKLSREWKPKQ
jgi:TPR repeat protein